MHSWRNSLLWVVLLTSGLAVAFCLEASPESASIAGLSGPECVVRDWTGHDCPGCGLTSATACVVKGRWGEAWRFHPAGYLIAPMMLGGVVLHASKLRNRVPSSGITEQQRGNRETSRATRRGAHRGRARFVRQLQWTLALVCLLVWLGRWAGAFPAAGSTAD